MTKPNNGLRVLVVDDEKSIRRFLKTALSSQGYRFFEAATGQSAFESLSSARPDVVILDPGLPDQGGVRMIQTIRKHSQIPIMIVSVRDQEADKIAALDAGADDYLTKPFTAGELLARMRAVIRRLMPQGQIFKTHELTFDMEKRIVKVQEKAVRLTPIEFEVLKILVLSAGKVVPHKQLFQQVWNKDKNLGRIDHLLRVTISNLRSKIEPYPSHPLYVLTEPGIGYRLTVDI